MKETLAAWVKQGLTRTGAILPPRLFQAFDSTINYLAAGRWLRDRGLVPAARVATRVQVFEHALTELADKRVLYLEFGVWRGKSTRFFSRGLKHPDAMLHGFDSFAGLPESYSDHRAGDLSTGGRLPQVDDARVQFFKGYFHETLPGYVVPPHEALLVNIDADLYSSTKLVLDFIEPHLKPGTLIYFDEFSDRHHEPRAFGEFLDRTGMKFELPVVSSTLTHALFRRIG